MALEGSEGMGTTMLVQPTNGFNNSGFGGFGGDSGWWVLILFFLLCGNNGWGNNGNYGGGGVQRGFDQAAVMNGINSINSSLVTGFGDIQQSFANAETAANARAVADMQQMFNLQSQFANCCCENRLGIADLKYTVATENCADRAAVSDGIRDIIAATQAQTQAILNKMSQDKLDAKNDEISQLRQEVLYARGQASQIAQNEAIVNSIYNRLDQCPVGTTPVYGRTPIFTCNNGGCGCNNGFAN